MERLSKEASMAGSVADGPGIAHAIADIGGGGGGEGGRGPGGGGGGGRGRRRDILCRWAAGHGRERGGRARRHGLGGHGGPAHGGGPGHERGAAATGRGGGGGR